MNPESNPSPFSENESTVFDAHDLTWLAFCYVADELDDDAMQAFESRLETDQEARDAVAFAVHQAQALHAAISNMNSNRSTNADRVSEPRLGYAVVPNTPMHTASENASPIGTSFWRRSAPLVTVAAALLVMAAIWAFEFGGRPAQANDEDLAAVWVSDSLNSENLYESLASVDLEDEDEIISVAFQKLDLNDEEDDWMLAALGEMDSDDPGYLEIQNEEGGLQ